MYDMSSFSGGLQDISFIIASNDYKVTHKIKNKTYLRHVTQGKTFIFR